MGTKETEKEEEKEDKERRKVRKEKYLEGSDFDPPV